MIRCIHLSLIARQLGRLAIASQFVREYNVKRINLETNPELSLQQFVPGTAEQWDPIRNGTLQPSAIPYNYDGYVWWKCPRGEDHVWRTKCRKRVDKENRRLLPCPFCSNRRISITNSLLSRFPTLAAEFDIVENGGLQANKILYTSKKPYVWKCKYNHHYRMTIQQRVKCMESGEQSCPFCLSDHDVSTRLVDVYPELFEESYNWLNCPSLSPPSIEDPEATDLPEDVFNPISYEELYFSPESDTAPAPPAPRGSSVSSELSDVDSSMRQSIRNHMLEYQVWKETLGYKDTRIIWWVCSANPNHVWRESVASRVRSQCPCCKEEQRSRNKQRIIVEPSSGYRGRGGSSSYYTFM
ncbi:hypothetical protein WA577_006108 [Blastocystis sp. JDR]